MKCGDGFVDVNCDLSGDVYDAVEFIPTANIYIWGAVPNAKYIFNARVATEKWEATDEINEYGCPVKELRTDSYQDFEIEFKIEMTDFKETIREVTSDGMIIYGGASKVSIPLDGDFSGDHHQLVSTRLSRAGN